MFDVRIGTNRDISRFGQWPLTKHGQCDIAYLQGGTFFPVEIKWTTQIRPEELKQVMVYPNGLILGRQCAPSRIAHVQVAPLIRYLLGL